MSVGLPVRADPPPEVAAVAPVRRAAFSPAIERELEPLAREWGDLARRTGAAPFLFPGWITAWWRAFGRGALEIATVRRDGRLAALWPLARRHGALRALSNSHSPECGMLAESRAAAEALARELVASRPSRLSAAPLAADGPGLEALLAAARRHGYRFLDRPFPSSPFLEIRGSWASYERGLSRNLTSDLRRCRRRLADRGEVRIELVDGPAGLGAPLRESFDVEAAGWKGERGTAIQSELATSRFYREVAHWAAERGMLRLLLLRVEGRAVAMLFALVHDGIWHLLKGGFDPEFARESPGKLLLHAALERAHLDGAHRIEFHGGAEPYKLRWTQAVRPRRALELFSGSPAGRCQWTVLGVVRPAAKRLLGRAGSPEPLRSESSPPSLPSESNDDGGTR